MGGVGDLYGEAEEMLKQRICHLWKPAKKYIVAPGVEPADEVPIDDAPSLQGKQEARELSVPNPVPPTRKVGSDEDQGRIWLRA